MSDISEPNNPYASHQEKIGPTIWHLDPLRQQWESHGFDEYSAHLWQQQGLNPVLSSTWRDAGFTPEEADQWLKASQKSVQGITPAEAIQWRNFGFSPELTSLWIKNFTPLEASKWRGCGFTFEESVEWSKYTNLSPHEASRWAILQNITPQKAAIWIENGLSDPDKVSVWIKNDFQLEWVIKWRKTWGKVLGYIPEEIDIQGWAAEGFTAKSAAEWYSLGFNPVEAAICRRAKIGIKQARAYLENS